MMFHLPYLYRKHMASIDINTIALIVEKNLRDIGLYKNTLEPGWKNTILGSNGIIYTLPSNLQKLRDAISQSIVDSLTTIIASGTLSVNNTMGVQTKSGDNSQISLNGKLIVGTDDTIQIDATTSPDLFTWLNTVSEFINTIAPGTVVAPTV